MRMKLGRRLWITCGWQGIWFSVIFGLAWRKWLCKKIAQGQKDQYYKSKVQTARFYFAKLFPETASLMQTARAGSDVLMDTADVFS